MELATINADAGFDVIKAIECVNNYSRSCNVECTIIDNNGTFLYNTNKSNEGCQFCRKVHELSGQQQNCSKVHLYGSYQAERFGGRYIFFCPLGLIHWASPITINGFMVGALLGGPVLLLDAEDFLLDDIINKTNSIHQEHSDELKKHICNIPIVPPSRVNSLSEMLFIVSTFISDLGQLKYIDDVALQGQQSDISQYLHHIKTMGGEDESNTTSYPIEKEKELLAFISEGNKQGAQKILNEILGYILFSTGANFNIMKARILELVVLLSRAALEGGADIEQIFGLNYKYLNDIHGFNSVDQLTYWLSKIMIRFTDCVFNLQGIKHTDVMYKAIDFVKHNYMRKISLEEVASHVYLSASYFSTVFKREMQCNFNTFLNKKRIEESKKLLLNQNINLLEVSSLVGYDDQSYFSKVFKKITGVSPGRYKESKGQVKNK